MNKQKAKDIKGDILFAAYSDAITKKDKRKAIATKAFKAMYRRKKKNVLLDNTRQYPKFELSSRQKRIANKEWTLKMLQYAHQVNLKKDNLWQSTTQKY